MVALEVVLGQGKLASRKAALKSILFALETMVIQQLFCSFESVYEICYIMFDKNKNNSIYVQGLDCLFYVLTGEMNCSLQLDIVASYKTKRPLYSYLETGVHTTIFSCLILNNSGKLK